MFPAKNTKSLGPPMLMVSEYPNNGFPMFPMFMVFDVPAPILMLLVRG